MASARLSNQTSSLLREIFKTAKTSPNSSIDFFTELVFDNLPPLVKSDLRKNGGKDELLRLVYYSRQRGFVNVDNSLTTKGHKRLLNLDFERISLDDSWDGKWRIVIFDIPQEHNSDRDKIRRLIKSVGFIQLQQSVWFHPMPTEDKVKEIQNAYDSATEIIYLEVNSISTSRNLLAEYRAAVR